MGRLLCKGTAFLMQQIYRLQDLQSVADIPLLICIHSQAQDLRKILPEPLCWIRSSPAAHNFGFFQILHSDPVQGPGERSLTDLYRFSADSFTSDSFSAENIFVFICFKLFPGSIPAHPDAVLIFRQCPCKLHAGLRARIEQADPAACRHRHSVR